MKILNKTYTIIRKYPLLPGLIIFLLVTIASFSELISPNDPLYSDLSKIKQSLIDVFKVDESSYIEQFLPKVLADRCTIMVVDKMGDTKGYITEKELAVSLSKDAHNIR